MMHHKDTGKVSFDGRSKEGVKGLLLLASATLTRGKLALGGRHSRWPSAYPTENAQLLGQVLSKGAGRHASVGPLRPSISQPRQLLQASHEAFTHQPHQLAMDLPLMGSQILPQSPAQQCDGRLDVAASLAEGSAVWHPAGPSPPTEVAFTAGHWSELATSH